MKPDQKPAAPHIHPSVRVLEKLFNSDLKGVGRVIVKGVRWAWRNQLIFPQSPETLPSLPEGPYQVTRLEQRGDLLLWVPRGLNSMFIDDITGGYGYSHSTVDCGEIDLPTGLPVMIELTVGQLVEHKFLNQYGQRHFIRLPLRFVGVNVDEFCHCVLANLGEPYDNLEAITWGRIDDPAKEVCSNMANECLPEALRADIASCQRQGRLRHFSVSVHSPPGAAKVKDFVSPNGFAQYFQAPEGKHLKRPGERSIPRPISGFSLLR